MSRFTWMMVPLVLLAGCGRGPAAIAGDGAGPDAAAPDMGHCPAGYKLSCSSPDHPGICVCEWQCKKTSATRCEGVIITPPDGEQWVCAWAGPTSYSCSRSGAKEQIPDAGKQWLCSFDAAAAAWTCRLIKFPLPSWGSGWSCAVDEVRKKLVCRTSSSGNDAGVYPNWSCKTVTGRKICQRLDGTHGLPAGGKGWRCNRAKKAGVAFWYCYGQAVGGAPPGGAGYTCVKKDEVGKGIWQCRRPVSPADRPPGGGKWACGMSAALAGTQCEEVSWDPDAMPRVTSPCPPGATMWCDGLQYDGWGTVRCLSSGKWATRTINGKAVFDCKENAGGLRPDTLCACYHFFTNYDCCERADCVLPPGAKGKTCAAGHGGLCSACNPLKPGCTEAKAVCVVTNSHETYCGRGCADGTACPAGYKCMTIKLKIGTDKQCIPQDQSCYY